MFYKKINTTKTGETIIQCSSFHCITHMIQHLIVQKAMWISAYTLLYK